MFSPVCIAGVFAAELGRVSLPNDEPAYNGSLYLI